MEGSAYNLSIYIDEDRQSMGARAAKVATDKIREMLKERHEINCVFAAAPSQNEFLDCLIRQDVDFSRINAFHMDEYVGLADDDERTFAAFLNSRIFQKVKFASVNLLCTKGKTANEQISAYTAILRANPLDITFMGIGENGHIAFNDPHVANFADNELVKCVTLDEICRMQQVNDKCFDELSDVPKEAVTLTIPALMSAKSIICVVPGSTKTNAVTESICGKVSESCPASIMRLHSDCSLFLDVESAHGLAVASR